MKNRISSITIFLSVVLMVSCNQATKVLVVVGGHDYDTTEFFHMFRTLDGIEFDSVSHPRALDLLKSSMINDFDLLLFYDFIPDMSLKDSTIFTRLTSEGKPMLFLHHSICSFQQWDGYQQMVGGKYVTPEFEEDLVLHSDYKHDIDLHVEILNNNHPVTKDVEPFIIHDEGYSNMQLERDIVPLFGTNHPDCDPVMGWAHQEDQSTILYLMFGHDKQAYENKSLQKILFNSIHWLSQ